MPSRPSTILMVEDEMPILKLMNLILSELGFCLLMASDGSQALDLCRNHSAPINLLVTDIQMPPHMNGLKLAHAVRDLRPGIHVLYISGYNSIYERILEEVDGIRTWFLQKPFTSMQLVAAVEKAM